MRCSLFSRKIISFLVYKYRPNGDTRRTPAGDRAVPGCRLLPKPGKDQRPGDKGQRSEVRTEVTSHETIVEIYMFKYCSMMFLLALVSQIWPTILVEPETLD